MSSKVTLLQLIYAIFYIQPSKVSYYTHTRNSNNHVVLWPHFNYIQSLANKFLRWILSFRWPEISVTEEWSDEVQSNAEMYIRSYLDEECERYCNPCCGIHMLRGRWSDQNGTKRLLCRLSICNSSLFSSSKLNCSLVVS